jgi:energy-coupling factor transport system ATP-binding protein
LKVILDLVPGPLGSGTLLIGLAENMNVASIHIENMSFAYTNNVPLFEQLNLSISSGSWVKVLGPSGSGKTTLLKLIKGVLESQEGTVFVKTEDQSRIHYIGGDPRDALIGVTVQEDLSFGLQYTTLSREEIDFKINEVLQAVGLESFSERLVSTLSGGEQFRLVLANALCLKGDVLLLDQSMDMLDPINKAEIVKLLRILQQAHGITILEVDQFLVDCEPSDRILFLHDGGILFDGTIQSFLRSDLGIYWLHDVNDIELLKQRIGSIDL